MPLFSRFANTSMLCVCLYQIPKPQVRTPAYVVLLSLLSAIGGFLFGYDTGIVSGALLPIQEQFHFDIVSKELFVSITGNDTRLPEPLCLNDPENELFTYVICVCMQVVRTIQWLLVTCWCQLRSNITSLLAVGAAAIFAIVGGQINDRFGRKPSTLIASAIFALGAILLAASQSSVMLLIGRFILGIGIGKTSNSHPNTPHSSVTRGLNGECVSQFDTPPTLILNVWTWYLVSFLTILGFSSCTVPLYIAECSPAHLRGRLVSLSVLCITGGQFVAGMISAVFCYDKQYGWR